MNKRTWHYIMKPHEYSMRCDKCDGINIEWSEYEGMIWCYDCEIDTKGFEGIFGSPIGWEVSKVLGISFNRWNMIEKRIEYPHLIDGKIIYLPNRDDSD